MRSDYPSGLVAGQGVGRSPVRFPAPRRSVRGQFFLNFGMSWDVSGSGLGTFWDGFGMVLKKNVGRGRTKTHQTMLGVLFLSRAD